MTPRRLVGLVALAALLIIIYTHFGTAPNWYRT